MVELLVTLFLIGVLTVISLFAFNMLFGKGEEGEAKGRLDRVMLAQQGLASSYGQFSPYGRDLKIAGSDFTIVENGQVSAGVDQVSVAVSSNGELGVAVLAGDTCFGAFSPSPATGGDVVYLDLPSGLCSGAQAVEQSGSDAPLRSYTPGSSILEAI